ncbi:MAG: DUF4345 domain-containing protein [Hyphomicrobiales bacterium]|nr:DUF4345 domain-containing protein [Hyphomicrobiales bacterium]
MPEIKLTIVRIGATILGATGLLGGSVAVYQGARSKLGNATTALGDPAVLAALDKDFRFLAGIWTIVGVSLLVGVILIRKKPELVQIGLLAVLLGGLAQLFAVIDYGLQPQFAAPIAIEIAAPIILLVLLKLSQPPGWFTTGATLPLGGPAG